MPTDHRAGFETQRAEATARLTVDGDLPTWLRGRYLSNGPGQFEVGGESLEHWFDPLAMLRGFRFEEGSVRYANRFVRSEDFAWARERGRVRTAFPGTPADRPPWTRLRQTLTGVFPDNPVIGVRRLDGEFLAVTEAPVGLRFDPDTLETTGRVDLTDGVDCDLTLAHLHHDPDAGVSWELGVSYGRGATYTLFRRPDDGGTPTERTRVRFTDAPYIHSFALTGRYAVLTVGPFGLDTTTLLRGAFTGETFLDAFGPLDGSLRFVVLDRETGAHVGTAEAPPAFVYHHANALETDGELVVDLVAYPDERAVTGLTLANLRREDPALPGGDLVRYRVPVPDEADGDRPTATRETLHAGPVEFPTVNYDRVNGREHRYVYLAETTRPGSSLPTAVAKVDVEGGVERWSEPDTYPGEPVFVPAPDTAAEDEGVLLSVLLAPDRGRSELLVLDAATLTERARAPLPHRLPYGFHGQFYGPHTPGRSVA